MIQKMRAWLTRWEAIYLTPRGIQRICFRSVGIAAIARKYAVAHKPHDGKLLALELGN